MPVTIAIRSSSLGRLSTARSTAPGPLTFDGSRIVIGRGRGCDIRLPDPSVSHRHASVRAQGADYALIDEGSTNGTFAGGVRLSSHAPRLVRSGELIRVGRVWLELRIEERPATRDVAAATRDLALALVADAMQVMGDDILPRVRVVEGPDSGHVLVLAEEGRAYILGRGESCDLPLTDVDASREHVQIVRRGGAVLVRDLHSKNGAFVADAALSADRDRLWRGAASMRVGSTVLTLLEPVALALAELEQADDEPWEGPLEEPFEKEEPAPRATRGAASSSETPAAGLSVGPTPAPVARRASSSLLVGNDGVRVGRGIRGAEPVRPRGSGWSGTDVAVVIAALLIIAISIAGLYWLLRG